MLQGGQNAPARETHFGSQLTRLLKIRESLQQEISRLEERLNQVVRPSGPSALDNTAKAMKEPIQDLVPHAQTLSQIGDSLDGMIRQLESLISRIEV